MKTELLKERGAMFKEFREFAIKGNVIDMAVGIIIGAAFGTVVKSLVSDVIMPPIGLLVGKVDFSALRVVLREATPKDPSVTLNYGLFINNIISFLIVSFAVFLLVKQMNRFRKQEAPTTTECPYCLSSVPAKARRCAHCTSDLEAAPAETIR